MFLIICTAGIRRNKYLTASNYPPLRMELNVVESLTGSSVLTYYTGSSVISSLYKSTVVHFLIYFINLFVCRYLLTDFWEQSISGYFYHVDYRSTHREDVKKGRNVVPWCKRGYFCLKHFPNDIIHGLLKWCKKRVILPQVFP